MPDAVYVTGIGCVLPGATGESELTAQLRRPATLVGLPGPGRDFRVAKVGEFDPSAWIRPVSRRRMNRIGVLATVSAFLALESAGIGAEEIPNERTGLALGTGLGCTQSIDDYFGQMMLEGRTMANPAVFSTAVPNAIASQVAQCLKISGPNVTVSQRGVSGEVALLLGMDWIRSGRARLVLVGGADELSHFLPQHLDGLGQIARGDGPSCPFDRSSTGAAVGEGTTFLVLEGKHAHARARARIVSGALHGVPAPAEAVDRSGTALRRCIQYCQEETRRSADVVVCGASGFRDLDLAFAHALRNPEGDGAPLVTAPKSIFGESLSSGVLSAAIAVIALTTGTVPCIAGLGEAHPECDGLRLLRAPATRAQATTAVVAGTASGGASAAIAFQS